MKTLVLLSSLLISTLISQAQEKPEGITITVTVPNVSNSEGAVHFGLYNESTFMKAAPIQGTHTTIKDGVATITFKNVPEGIFAISCYHDKNGNNRMDFEDNGRPIESYGISNNTMSYGPPTWEAAKFVVGTEDLDLSIRM
ncbi:DUF2141 domain-containing protein [Aquimarina sp. U1-2]|uniref:DUF2141 domain-containing protein n=1 Tax=Aquimarina sp. U1-2 TaxID=2823141 RepID=UPI001AECBE8C|nr:DUF2141 domain-containing protein [Aquimarina sp. U1-2]MBP2833422.1 DUF2141 domain-containing protein [Aquimarina sp. U1-2]